MKRLWKKFVKWLAEEHLAAQREFFEYSMREYETNWRHAMEALRNERDAYKQRYEYILNLQAEALSLQPMQPIIMKVPEEGPNLKSGGNIK